MGDETRDSSETRGFASVDSVADLYLGNILYALELTATQLETEQRHEDAAFYRGIARKLAEARGRVARPPGTDR